MVYYDIFVTNFSSICSLASKHLSDDLCYHEYKYNIFSSILFERPQFHSTHSPPKKFFSFLSNLIIKAFIF